MKKTKEGISLIVLVITIIVIIILAGAVILSISNNNPISSANEATFKTNVKNYETELNMYITKQYTNSDPIGSFDKANANYNNTTTPNISTAIKIMKTEDTVKFEVQEGALVYIKDKITENEKIWLEDIGIKQKLHYKMYTDKEGNKAPIPIGFVVSSDPKENIISKGLVIKEGSNGSATDKNEFVWIPVTAQEVKDAYEAGKTESKDLLPSNMANEDDIIKYGGFYIGRYETGKEGTTPVIKKGVLVWNDIKYSNSSSDLKGGAYEAASKIYDNIEEVKSGLITKAMWNATCKWLEISEAKTNSEIYTDSTTWGNYSNNTDRNIVTPNNPANAGAHSNWNANNIYDLAGNVMEWINNKEMGVNSANGGYCGTEGTLSVSKTRMNGTVGGAYTFTGFRTSLYIK